VLKASIIKNMPNFAVEAELSLAQGILVLFGPSGSGKTTILNCLAGLQTPTAGQISLGDKVFFSSAHHINIPARLRRIGYVFQDYALFPHMTVKDNAQYGVPACSKSCKGNAGQVESLSEVLDMLRISHLRDRYPAQLSGGEKQRVALARALMMEPDLLLLDEPLSAIDAHTRRALQQELKNIQRNRNIPFVLVTHSQRELDTLADEVVFLKDGKAGKAVGRTAPTVGALAAGRGLSGTFPVGDGRHLWTQSVG